MSKILILKQHVHKEVLQEEFCSFEVDDTVDANEFLENIEWDCCVGTSSGRILLEVKEKQSVNVSIQEEEEGK